MIFCLDASFLGTRFSFSVGESGQVWPVTHPMGKPGLTSSQDHMASKGSWKGVLSLHLGASYMHNVPGGGGLAGLSGWKQPCSFLFLLQTRPKLAGPRLLQQTRKQRTHVNQS